MTLAFEHLKLWKRTLASSSGDEFDKERSWLRTSLLKMRDNASQLVQMIPKDCRGITVHDVTHLDALWEMADLIAGDNFDINPAEAFVLGGAILLHDSGMSIASYPKGLNEIKNTIEWKDIVASLLRRSGVADFTATQLEHPPADIYEEALFNVLRALHARNAENLVSATWLHPTTHAQLCLLEDLKLRQAYGRSIGRVAHSHHWSVDVLENELKSNAGVAPDLPASWKLDEVKVACLLRCCDAAHIDNRRAPSLLFALSQPSGVSREHWDFQNKLNKPTLNGDALIYAGEDFPIKEANSWWLCYDTIKLINKELSQSDALLEDSKRPTFAAKRVFGAENPKVLAKQIRPLGWQPILAEIQVSDPISLAQTLGGRNLYGAGPFAPVRELLQNAVDAVRARRKLDDRGITWGKIRLRIEELEVSGKQETWLHVDDNGVGMSERVLVRSLLDFGRSFWNSSLLREEFPGLESRGIRPIGKFGIGFFSVFLLGQKVKVISKKYDLGTAETRVLEFSSIVSRPILRSAHPNELPQDFSTRVSVRIDDPQDLAMPSRAHLRMFGERTYTREVFLNTILHLTAALDVEFEIEDATTNFKSHHGPDWLNAPSEVLLGEILADQVTHVRSRIITAHAPSLMRLDDENGINYGRAALAMIDSPIEVTASRSVSVGGFLYDGMGIGLNYWGVVVGDTNTATRERAHAIVPARVVSSWATKQAAQIDQSKFPVTALVKAAQDILRVGGNPGRLPICYSGKRFITLDELERKFASFDQIHLPLDRHYDDDFEPILIGGMTSGFFANGPIENMVVTQVSGIRGLFGSERAKEIRKKIQVDIEDEDEASKFTSLAFVLELANRVWQSKPIIRLQEQQIFSEVFYQPIEKRWCLSLVKRAPL